MGLSLKQSDIAILEHKTEGWIVGLQLAGLSMRDGANPSSFIAGLKGSHRIILSYLTEQVLGRQPQDFRQFLLETSILEALNGDLCDALTLRSDGSVMLEQLFDGNLFLIPLDDERRWYRYHHLFADLLYDLLVTSQKDRLEELHQRASRWYSRAGMVNEAIEHSLAARDFAMAVELLETHAMEMIAQGYVKTVNTWVEALPQEWIFRSPKTNLAFAWALLLHGTYSQASPYLKRLERGFNSIEVKDGEGRSRKAELYVINALLSNMEGKISEGLSLADEAIRIVPESDNRVLSLAYFGRAGAFQALDNYAEAEIAYQKAIKYGRASGNLIAEMMGASGLAQLAFEQGRLHLAYEICTPMISRGNELSSPFPISTVVFGSLGMIYFHWYQTKQAREYLNKALQLSILGGLSSGVINCHILLSRLSQIEGDWEAANRETELALDLLRADTPAYIIQEAIAQQVVVCLAQNRLGAAKIALQRQGFSFNNQFVCPVLSLEHGITHSQILLYNSALATLIYLAHNRGELANLSNGIELANQLINWALESQSILAALEVLLLRGQIHALLGDRSNSLADYYQALELGYPEGFIGVFVEQGKVVGDTLAQLVVQNQLNSVPRDYIVQILDAYSTAGFISGQSTGQTSPGEDQVTDLIESLSVRELEVLRLMIDGLKYKEIAERLFISLNTVRFHIKTIYGKLNVNNRTQAIEKSHQLHLL